MTTEERNFDQLVQDELALMKEEGQGCGPGCDCRRYEAQRRVGERLRAGTPGSTSN